MFFCKVFKLFRSLGNFHKRQTWQFCDRIIVKPNVIRFKKKPKTTLFSKINFENCSSVCLLSGLWAICQKYFSLMTVVWQDRGGPESHLVVEESKCHSWPKQILKLFSIKTCQRIVTIFLSVSVSGISHHHWCLSKKCIKNNKQILKMSPFFCKSLSELWAICRKKLR